MKKNSAVFIFLLLITALSNLDAQNFSRIIQMQRNRMNGADVTRVQRRLLAMGFRKTGAADGWYGPLTEGSVKTIQYYMGFSQDGRVTRAFWDVLFDSKNDDLLKDISIVANYVPGTFIVTSKRNGSDSDFDEFVISTQNNEVKTVLFQHINKGLIMCRFRLWYLADTIVMIQDIYYGDTRTHVYLKTAEGFFILKDGLQNPADVALEGIITRSSEGIESVRFTVPPLVQSFGTAQPAVDQKAAAGTE